MTTVTDPRPPTNPDVLTLAVAAAERAATYVSTFATWCSELDVDWAYFPPDGAHRPGFYANAVAVLHPMPVVRPEREVRP